MLGSSKGSKLFDEKEVKNFGLNIRCPLEINGHVIAYPSMNGYNAAHSETMVTSTLLVIILVFLTVSLIVTVIAAWRKVPIAYELALTFVAIGLFLWLLLGFDLPHLLTLLQWAGTRENIRWSLLVDTVTWRFGLYLLLLCTTTLLIARPQLKPVAQESEISTSQRWALPILLLLLLTGLLAILAENLAAMASSWTILVISWFMLFWIGGRPIIQLRRALILAGTLLLGVGFLWLAEAALPGSIPGKSNSQDWSEPAIIWASFAAMVYIGAVPFHWWRTIVQTRRLTTPTTALIQLVPVVVGGSLIARIAAFETTNTGYLLFMTGFGLIGFLAGISVAWMHLGKPRNSLAGFILAEAGSVMLVGVWASPSAVVGQVGVFTLAMASFYMVSEKPRWRFNWPIIIPVAAIAGMPLTVGFTGVAALYGSWLDHDLLALTLVAAFLNVPLIAVALLAWRSEEPIMSTLPFDRFQPFLERGGLALLSLGLLTLPDFPQTSNDVLILLSILLAGVGGIALAWFAAHTSLAQADLKDAFRINLPREQAKIIIEQFSAGITLIVRETISILEGEGGMIWVVVLIIVMWLARRS